MLFLCKNLTVCHPDNTTHNLLKMIFTERPLPCNYSASALCPHGTNSTHLHACIKAKVGYFGHNLP